MIDVQSGADLRGIAIPDVGISGVRHVVTTGDQCSPQRTVAEIAIGVALQADRKGTHMSRLIEVLLEHHEDFTVMGLPVVAKRLLAHLDADAGGLRVSFPLVIERAAPVTQGVASNVHDAHVAVHLDKDVLRLEVGVEVVATSLCPCSKLISEYGAHNQRSRIQLAVDMTGEDAPARLPALEDLVRWAEDASSCPTYPLLKRPDERHVTMQAYDHPVFVEDIVRDVALTLARLDGPGSYRIRVTNEESIHRHDAYATMAGDLE